MLGRRSTWTRVIVFAVSTTVVVLCVLVATFLLVTHQRPIVPPSDQSLISLFHEYHKDFKELERIHSDSQVPQEVLESFGKLSPIPRIAVTPPGLIRIIFSETGVAIGPGWAKGIEYESHNFDGGTIADNSLDKVGGLAPGVYLRPIEQDWYIFYQKDDD